MDIFLEIRQLVTPLELVERLGIEPRKGRIACPFHQGQDRNLSFHEGYFKCFVCDAKGDAVKFGELYWNCNPIEAARKINEIFNLNLFLTDSSNLFNNINNHSKIWLKIRDRKIFQERRKNIFKLLNLNKRNINSL